MQELWEAAQYCGRKATALTNCLHEAGRLCDAATTAVRIIAELAPLVPDAALLVPMLPAWVAARVAAVGAVPPRRRVSRGRAKASEDGCVHESIASGAPQVVIDEPLFNLRTRCPHDNGISARWRCMSEHLAIPCIPSRLHGLMKLPGLHLTQIELSDVQLCTEGTMLCTSLAAVSETGLAAEQEGPRLACVPQCAGGTQ